MPDHNPANTNNNITLADRLRHDAPAWRDTIASSPAHHAPASHARHTATARHFRTVRIFRTAGYALAAMITLAIVWQFMVIPYNTPSEPIVVNRLPAPADLPIDRAVATLSQTYHNEVQLISKDMRRAAEFVRASIPQPMQWMESWRFDMSPSIAPPAEQLPTISQPDSTAI